jgi:transposase
MYLSLVDTFKRTKHPRLKKLDRGGTALDMPLLNRTGGVAVRFLEQNEAGEWERLPMPKDQAWNGNGPARWCEVHFGSHWIRGKYWRTPQGPFIEGVAISLDGLRWMASLRTRAQPRELPPPTKGSVGVNLGLIHTAATSDGKQWEGVRTNDYLLRVRGFHEAMSAAEDSYDRDRIYRRFRQFSARWARKAREQVRAEIVPYLGQYAEIRVAVGKQSKARGVVEKGTIQDAAQGRQTAIGTKDGGGYISAQGLVLRLLRERYGDRVVEVDWSWASQLCSKCGHAPDHPLRGTGASTRFICNNARCPEAGIPHFPSVNTAKNVLKREPLAKRVASA